MRDHTLQELVHLVKEGSSSAFSELYKRTWEKLFHLAYHKTKEEEEAKDIVQDIYIQFWQKKDRIDIQGAVEAYLYSMTKYEIIRRMQQALKEKANNSYYYQLITEFMHPSYETLFANELEESLRKEINALPEKQRLIYKLHHEADYSTGEIAEKLDIAEQTVKNQLVTANRKIRLAIKSQLLSILFL